MSTATTRAAVHRRSGPGGTAASVGGLAHHVPVHDAPGPAAGPGLVRRGRRARRRLRGQRDRALSHARTAGELRRTRALQRRDLGDPRPRLRPGRPDRGRGRHGRDQPVHLHRAWRSWPSSCSFVTPAPTRRTTARTSCALGPWVGTATLAAASTWVFTVVLAIGIGLTLGMIAVGLPTAGSVAFGAATVGIGLCVPRCRRGHGPGGSQCPGCDVGRRCRARDLLPAARCRGHARGMVDLGLAPGLGARRARLRRRTVVDAAATVRHRDDPAGRSPSSCRPVGTSEPVPSRNARAPRRPHAG